MGEAINYLDELLNRYRTHYENENKRINKEFMDAEQRLLDKGISKNDIECIIFAQYMADRESDEIEELQKTYKDRITSSLKEMDVLTSLLPNLFGKTCQVEANYLEGTIRFNPPCERLSTLVMVLASYFNWKPVDFGFASSFTTHNAKTAFDKEIRIGFDPQDDNKILIDYRFLKESK